MTSRPAVLLLLLPLLLLDSPAPVLAWGRDGHAIIAAVAETLLTPEARLGALALLAKDTPPAANLSAVSSWADQMTHTQQFVSFIHFFF